MRRYSRQKKQFDQILGRVKDGTILPTELEALIDEFYRPNYDGTDIVKGQKTQGDKLLHNLNGVQIRRFWRTTAYDKGFTYELTYKNTYFAGRSAFEVLQKARQNFQKTPRRDQHVGEILALRGWALQGETLTSIGGADWKDRARIWPGPIMHAHEKPDLYNTSGLYAVKLTPTAIKWLVTSYQPAAYGFVGMYGTVVEMQNGWRAEHMVIRRLILRMPASEAYTKIISDKYECDVVVEKRFRI